MNEQEHAQRIGEILIDYFSGKEIHCDGTGTLAAQMSSGEHLQILVSDPEKYHTKKEPRFIYVNVYPNTNGSGSDIDRYDEKDAATVSATLDCLVVAHRIEIPT